MLNRLRATGLPFRLVTNETQNPLASLVEKLNGFGYDFLPSEVIAPAPTVRQYLRQHQLRPYLLVHKSKPINCKMATVSQCYYHW